VDSNQKGEIMAKKIAKNQVFGDWKLKKFLGGGGNGDVWLAVNSKNEEAAIKLLRKIERKTYVRFINEVNIIKANNDIEGILPILDSYLPDKVADEIPWYVMPVAQSLEKHLEGKYFEDIILAITEIAKVLVELHKRNISHRDIKPENLLYKDGKFYLGDFGLVDYPEKIELTSSGDVIGAKWTMAPEMRREGSKSDGKPADVYSLAKTLWILITKNKKGFDGQYNSDSINGLTRLRLTEKDSGISHINDNYKQTVFIKPLEDLLHNSTDDVPLQRPTIQHFLEILSWWVVAHKDLETRNPIEWQDLQKQLFPTTMPHRVIWENINDIVYILNLIGSTPALNHMFYPFGGGNDLGEAKLGLEPGTIELIIGTNYVELIKLKRLIFENFASDTQWNYFRIETDELEPTGIGYIYRDSEELIEIEPLNYIDSHYWDKSNYEGERPSSARLVHRRLKGDFVIFAKTSIYNRSPTTYDARHNQLNADTFREYINQKVEKAETILQDQGIIKLAKEKGITMNDVLTNYFDADFHKDYMERFRSKAQESDELF